MIMSTKQMFRITLHLVLLAIAVSIFTGHLYAAAPTFTFGEQEIIETLFSQRTVKRPLHVVEDTTSVRSLQGRDTYEVFAMKLRKQAKPYNTAFNEALDDFIQKNKAAVEIVFPTNAPKGVLLVTSNITDQIFSVSHGAKPDGWNLFYQRFPNSSGLITISRVGMDSKGTVAIVYLGQQSGYRSGFGSIRILRKGVHMWLLTDESFGPEWVS